MQKNVEWGGYKKGAQMRSLFVQIQLFKSSRVYSQNYHIISNASKISSITKAIKIPIKIATRLFTILR